MWVPLVVGWLAVSTIAVLPNISFQSGGWKIPPSPHGNLTNGELMLQGNPSGTIQATLTVNINPSTFGSIKSLIFMAFVRIDELSNCGSEDYDAAKVKIYRGDNHKSIIATNLDRSFQGRWYNSGVEVKNFASLLKHGLPSIILEFAIQNCAGYLSVENPSLLDKVPPPKFDWPFNPPSSSDATVDVKTTGSTPFNNNLFSANEQFVFAPFGLQDPRIAQLLSYIRLPQLRFPGGTVGNYYNWKSDAFYNDSWARSSPGRAAAIDKGYKFGFESYCKNMLASNTSSVLMFNVIEDDALTSSERLKDRLSHGLHIDHVEMGNENYFPTQSQGHVDHNVEKYITFTRNLTSALKQVDPTIKTTVNVGARQAYAPGSWNYEISQVNPKYFDAVVMHPYVASTSAIFSTASMYIVLTAHSTLQSYVTKYNKYFNTPLLFTEWGILPGKVAIWPISLGEADQWTAIAELGRQGRVIQAGKHILFSSPPEGLFTWNGTQLVASPSGVWYKKFLDTFRDGEALASTVQVADVAIGLPAITAVAGRSTSGTFNVVLVNKLNTTSVTQVALDGKAVGSCTVQTFSAGPMDWPTFALNDDPWVSSNCQGNKATLPPLSVAVISFKA